MESHRRWKWMEVYEGGLTARINDFNGGDLHDGDSKNAKRNLCFVLDKSLYSGKGGGRKVASV